MSGRDHACSSCRSALLGTRAAFVERARTNQRSIGRRPAGTLPREGKKGREDGKGDPRWTLVCSIAVFMVSTLTPTTPVGADEGSQIQRGFQIAPVPLDLKRQEPCAGGAGQLHRQRAGRL